jgi:hypothetical protein
MMLLVVKLHDLPANERLEGIIAIREIGESMLAGHVVIDDDSGCMWWWLKGEIEANLKRFYMPCAIINL